MNIPQEAVEAAARAIEFHRDCTNIGEGEEVCCMYCGAQMEGFVPGNYISCLTAFRRHQAQSALNAALPAIEKEIRAQVAAELRGELPVQLAETAQSRIGWLSDMQGLHPEASEDDPCDDTWVIFKDFYGRPFGSIDISHISEHAARIAEGESE